MKLHRKKQIFVITLALLVGLIACRSTPESNTNSPGSSRSTEVGLPGKGVKVRPAASSIVASQLTVEILRIGLEKLGYEVEELKVLMDRRSDASNSVDRRLHQVEQIVERGQLRAIAPTEVQRLTAADLVS